MLEPTMAIIQADLQMLRQAIRQLSRIEREELAEWILNSPDLETGVTGVAEPVLPYGTRRYLTVAEYLRFEQDSLESHEYVAGYVFPLGTPIVRHNIIATNVAAQFQSQLRGTPCRAFSSRVKLRLQLNQDDLFYVPDVMISCGPFTEEMLEARWLTNPCVVVEVLSASTEAIDRREKALNYRQIPSLEEYVLVAQRSMEVTVFRRGENWHPRVLSAPEDVFESRAVEVNVALANIYEGVR
jgi:Uma2 family endonuclease